MLNTATEVEMETMQGHFSSQGQLGSQLQLQQAVNVQTGLPVIDGPCDKSCNQMKEIWYSYPYLLLKHTTSHKSTAPTY